MSKTEGILLDLFCGVGGISEGYSRAGYEIVGVDIAPQPDYPFEFIRADAFNVSPSFMRGFDVVHASPPCQAYSNINRSKKGERRVREIFEFLSVTASCFVVENVLGAAKDMMGAPIRLHGGHFGMDIWRPRLFSSSHQLTEPPRRPRPTTEAAVYGDGARRVVRERRDGSLLETASVPQAQRLLGIEWCDDWDSLREAIPPIYSHVVGLQLLGEPWEHLVAPMPRLECSDCRGDRFDLNDRYCRPCRALRMRRYRAERRDTE